MIVFSPDATYFSAGVPELFTLRSYDIVYHNVTYDSQSEELFMTKRLSVKADRNWLNCKWLSRTNVL